MANYVLYRDRLIRNINKLCQSFVDQEINFKLFYSVKTNNFKDVLAEIYSSGSNFEIVSGYEWDKIKGFNPKEIVLNGPAKSLELVKAILVNVETVYFNIDNDTDIEVLSCLNNSELQKIKAGIRIYFDNDLIWNRFGYNIDSDLFLSRLAVIQRILPLKGIHFHFSTNNFSLENYRQIFSKIKSLDIYGLEFINIGGGLPPSNDRIFEEVTYFHLPSLINSNFPNLLIISEAGRNIVANTMDLDCQISSIKQLTDCHYSVSVDTNIMHFQCFFERKYGLRFSPAMEELQQKSLKVDIYGNSCMQVDCLAVNFLIGQKPKIGDRVIIENIGAYSQSQAANFISLIPSLITQ